MRATTYQLHIRISAPETVTIGKLGRFEFPAGEYIYTGSARRNLEARIRRHLSCEKKLHWHIDYLLAAPGVDVIDVIRSEQAECELNKQVAGKNIVAGFGASDCRQGCQSHLKYVNS